MTTTRHIIDITADLVPGFEAAETSDAKNIAYEILEWTYVPDSGDAITAADRVVEALIKSGWRPTIEEPAAEHHGEPNADDPTDAEVLAAAEEAEHHEQWGYDENGFPHCECGASLVESKHTRSVVPPLMAHQARAALVAARKAARHE